MFRNVAMTLLLGMVAHDAAAQMIKGTAAYRERMALPEKAAQESLVGIYWKAVELAGTPAPTLAANREVHVVFDATGRFSGSDGSTA